MEEEALGKAYDSRIMRRLLRYMKPYRAIVTVSLLLLLVDSLLQIIGPLLTKLAVDRYLVPTPHAHTFPFSTNGWPAIRGPA